MAIDQAEAAGRGSTRRSSRPAAYLPRQGVGAQITGSLSAALAGYAADVQQQALRSAVYAGAKLLTDELMQRVPVDRGVLKGSIYTWHDKGQSVDGRQVYAVGVNKREARHWYNVEYGHWRVNVLVKLPSGKIIATKERLPAPVWTPAHPYLRPTADAMPQALAAAKARLGERLRELAQERAA